MARISYPNELFGFDLIKPLAQANASENFLAAASSMNVLTGSADLRIADAAVAAVAAAVVAAVPAAVAAEHVAGAAEVAPPSTAIVGGAPQAS